MSKSSILSLCLVSGVVMLSVGVYLTYDLVQDRAKSFLVAQEKARQQAVDTARDLDEELKQYAKLADDLAADLHSGRLTPSELSLRLTGDLDANPDLQGMGVAYAPFAHDARRRLFAPYGERRGESLRLLQLEDTLDYTTVENGWYVDAVRGQAGWREPVWRASDQSLTVTYSTGFPGPDWEEQGRPAGVVFLSVTMDPIQERLQALELGNTGFAAILSKQGYTLADPSRARIRARVSFFEVPEAQSDPSFRAALESATRGESGSVERDNRLTGQSSWIFYEPVVEPGWSMIVVLIKDEVPVDPRAQRRRIIWITASTILGLIGVATWWCLRWYQNRPRNAILWGLVAFSSILMWTGIFVIRQAVFNQPSDDDRDGVAIVDQSGLDAFLHDMARSVDDDSPEYIPTGVFLQSMKFVGPDEIFVTGYVWQKYSVGRHGESYRGFVLPDATDPRITVAYRFEENGVETVGWHIETALRQKLNVSRYPFDHDEVTIRLRPRDFNQRVVLIPDLASYDLIHPKARPGLADDLAVSGWRVVGTFFEYKFEKYNSSLGLPGRIGEMVPELNFNVRLQRYLLAVIIGNGIPLIVILILLFAMFAAATRDPAESKLLGFNPSGVVKIASGLLFIAILAHIHLRNTIQVDEVVFMEYAYFLVYVAIVLTTLHNFLFSLERFNRGRLGYRDGLVQKLLFWPSVFGSLLLITILNFY